jgi:uncharacterized protein involved in exopolysaccharide biosynthesis
MYLSDLVRGLGRRWYVLVAGLIVTAAGAFAVFQAIPVRYEAAATMMLLPPQKTLEVEGDNPYLVLGGMGQALAVLTTRLNAPETQKALAGDTDALRYGASADTASGAPFLELTADAPTAGAALALLDKAEAEATTQLAGMQSELSIGASSVIGVMTVTSAAEATAVTTTRTQLTIAAAGVGLVATVAIAAALDGLLAARARRRAAAEAPAPRERGRREPLLAREVLGQSSADHRVTPLVRTDASEHPRAQARKRTAHAAANASSGR